MTHPEPDDGKVTLFECLYNPQQTTSDPGLTPLRIKNDRPQWRELQAYLEIFQSKQHLNSDLIGMFSPKFSLKTHLTISEFKAFALKHSSADVCLVNPFPQLRYWSYNVWMQGEHAHPGLRSRSQAVLDAAGIQWNLHEIPRHDAKLLAYGNFWVAKPAFWEAYVGEILSPIARFLIENPLHPAAIDIMEGTRHTDHAPFLPFMIERLFSTYISINPQLDIAAIEIPSEKILDQYCTNDFERLLVKAMQQEIDDADAQQRFGPELISKMNMMCALFQQHFFDYYAHRPHPHSGQVVH